MLRYALTVLTFFGTLTGVVDTRAFGAETCADVLKPKKAESLLDLVKDPVTAAATESFSTEKKSWGEIAFEKDLRPVADFFAKQKGKSEDEILANLAKSEIRVLMFRLQSTAKIYSARDDKFFGDLRAEFKTFEDRLGAIGLAKDLRKEAEKLGNDDLVRKFKLQEREATESLREFLNEGGWLKNSAEAIGRIRKSLKNYDGWTSVKKDREFVIGEMKDSVKELRNDVEKMKFDKVDIEKGLHELRRRLRWVIIQLTSFDGFVVRQDEKLPKDLQQWFDQLHQANPKMTESKYLRFSDPLVADPIKVPLKLQSMIGELVELIGKQKDKAEAIIYIKEALNEPGLSSTNRAELTKKLEELMGTDNVDHRELSVQYMEKLNDTKLLKEFSEQLEEMN